MSQAELRTLGNTVREFISLEPIPAHPSMTLVTMRSDEVTALCPVTSQPDWYTVTVTFVPDQHCLESKSLKLYFHALRNEGIFCEDLAAKVAHDVFDAISPRWCRVTIEQKPRGGVAIAATARVPREEA